MTRLEFLKKKIDVNLFAHTGVASTSHGSNASNKLFENSWIVNSGDKDHMNNNSEYFHTYTPCPNNKKIVIVDSSLNTIICKGDIEFTFTLILKSILHVLKLCTNLVSINKFSQDLNYLILLIVTFAKDNWMCWGKTDFATWMHWRNLFLLLLLTSYKRFGSSIKDLSTYSFLS